MSRDGTLQALIGKFPGWHGWVGVTGALYARQVRSSPPVVVKADDAAGLAAEIERAESAIRDGRLP